MKKALKKEGMMRLRETEKAVLSWPLGDPVRGVSETKENVTEM